MFSGSCVALVTPFKDGAVDEKKLRDLVEFHIANKTNAIVPCGTTGESATLSHEEHRRVVKIVVEQAKKRIPVVAGAGSNSTQEALGLTAFAKEVGADAVLSIVPYYNKPTQKGMVEHFSAIAKQVAIPIIIYNIPGRTAVNMLPQTLAQIVRANKNVVGVKESSGDLMQIGEMAAALRGHKDFRVYSGDDGLTLPVLAVGGSGVISVLANIAPREVSELCSAYAAGNHARALELHQKCLPLIKAIFIETNPAPVKTAMEMMGLLNKAELRLPMCHLTADNKEKLARELKSFGLLQ